MMRISPSQPATSSIWPPRPGNQMVVSPISLAEIVYLVEKNRLPPNTYTDLKAALDDPDHVFKEAPFTVEIVDAMRQVPRADVPDMPDRIVAATAVYFGVPVISRDGRIRASSVQTVWWFFARPPLPTAVLATFGGQPWWRRVHLISLELGWGGPGLARFPRSELPFLYFTTMTLTPSVLAPALT